MSHDSNNGPTENRPRGAQRPSFNARTVIKDDPLHTSGTVDVFTGIMSEGRLNEVAERAVFDEGSLEWHPIADSGTGVLFPGAVESKATVESHLRSRPTVFKGPQQLDVDPENSEAHFERQIHPNAWESKNKTNVPWSVIRPDMPFSGYPNPNYFNAYTDSIPTHHVQDLSHSQLTAALKARSEGGFDHNSYLETLGALLSGESAQSGGTQSEPQVRSDGGGVNADPRILERIQEEYETGFRAAKRIAVQEVVEDPRFVPSAPGYYLQKEVQDRSIQQETQFAKVSRFAGIASGYTEPERINVG